MEKMRQTGIPQAAGKKVIAVRDYEKPETTGLPKSNVLYFELEDDCWFCVRPSGTEPKIKFYFGVKAATLEKAEELLNQLKTEVLNQFGA